MTVNPIDVTTSTGLADLTAGLAVGVPVKVYGTPQADSTLKAYAIAYKSNADVYAVQGYDAAQLLGAGLKAVNGDLAKRDQLTAAMRKSTVDSPRGKFTLSAAGNPVQDIYLREVKGNNNEFRSVAVKALADPARGCKL